MWIAVEVLYDRVTEQDVLDKGKHRKDYVALTKLM